MTPLASVAAISSEDRHLNTQASTRHHYLPVFYTKRWAQPRDGRICEFSRPYQSLVKPRRVHPSGTGYVDHLYEMKGLNKELVDQFERLFLMPVDSKASAALAIIETDDRGDYRWSSEEKSAWTRFLFSLLMRMPEDVADLKALVAADWAKPDPTMQARYEAVKLDGDPPTMMEWIQKNDPHVVENSSFQIALTLMDHRHLGEVINNFRWFTLLTGAARHELLTSDRPVLHSATLGRDDAYLMLPIGPRRLFVATRTKDTGDRIRRLNANDLTMRINVDVVEGAAKYAFGADDRQLRFVQNRLSAAPREGWLSRLKRMREGVG